MRMAFVNLPVEYYNDRTGGAVATVMMEMAAALTKQGDEVAVLTYVDENPPYDAGSVISLGQMPKAQGRVSAKTADIVRRVHRYDWLHYRSFLHSVRGGLSRLAPPPDVVIVNNDLKIASYIKRWLPSVHVVVYLHNETAHVASIPDAASRAVARYVTPSKYLQGWFVTQYGVAANQTAVVPNGVNLETFTPATASREGPLRAIFVGRINPDKGVDTAVAACRLAREAGADLTVTVVGSAWWYGDDSHNEFVRDIVATVDHLGGQRIRHVARHEVAELLRESDLALLLSRCREGGGPLVLFEALASGCVVLAGNRGSTPEFSLPGVVIQDPEDAAAAAKVLVELARDRKKLRMLQQQAQTSAMSCSWESRARELQAVLRAAVR
jgi:glycosyltransferase involved in cell wall biosynthesis